jgi:uncharacterized OB-fold protein
MTVPDRTVPNVITESFPRVRPKVTNRNAHFWQGGADGILRLLRCQDCGTYLHPPTPVCRSCRSTHVAPEPLSGRGTVYAFTVNHYRWVPDMEPPYVVALVELAEQAGLQLMTNIVGCPLDEVHTGMEVEVVFAHNDDVYVPLFRPAGR